MGNLIPVINQSVLDRPVRKNMVVAIRKRQTGLDMASSDGGRNHEVEQNNRSLDKASRFFFGRTGIVIYVVIIILGLLWKIITKEESDWNWAAATKAIEMYGQQRPEQQGVYGQKKKKDQEIPVSKLIALENRFGGFVRNVPRQVVSKHDPRSKTEVGKGGMTGGDRMSYDNHNYGVIYENILRSLPTPVTAVAEIGILKGSGLAIWSELFPNAKVHGFDINLVNIKENMDFLKARGAFASNNLELHEFDQFQPTIATKEMFQFVIDDGFHTDETVQRTFEAFEPWLHERGTYVVEDCICNNFRKEKH
ncbi:hypothetical protein PSENEW3n2_00000926 [Picochlorum sp. SENEW3]|nr:hypothetical protein PSENEW3n2_00000926 [Picochlorum sp. SENEW3]WPT14982.1 LOW QUALITY PROTEIN: hypothetical protein PSENEW3_00000926 [Picochlorum sp. SENEW3]